MFDPNWTRWVEASIAKYFDANKQNYNLFLHGIDDPPIGNKEGAELRINGPIAQQRTKTFWALDFTVNLLVQSKINDQNAYEHQDVVGFFTNLFVPSISVFKLGKNPEIDTQEFLACLEQTEDIEALAFGQISPEIRVLQSTLVCQYRVELLSTGD